MKNTGGSPIEWASVIFGNWANVSQGTGTLEPNATTTITVSINSTANGFSAGSYNDKVFFANKTNHSGDCYRDINLTVSGTPGVLSVTPPDPFNSSGTQGGTFTPPSKTYTLKNTGGSSINWSAAGFSNWADVSQSHGSLEPNASFNITVSINSNANSLSAGSYNDKVFFVNNSNHNGDCYRDINLTVSGTPGVLSVTPPDAFNSSGTQGGPFTPPTKTYTLKNTGGSPIEWASVIFGNWANASQGGGTLEPNATTTVTVSINSNANSFSAGSYNDKIFFVNKTNHGGDCYRDINLTVIARPGATLDAAVISDGTGPNYYSCNTPNGRYNLSPTDPFALLYVRVSNVPRSFTFKYSFYRPDGSLYSSQEISFTDWSYSYVCFYPKLEIAGSTPATVPGRWSAYYNYNDGTTTFWDILFFTIEN